MFQRLRKKFILLAMALMLVVFTVIISAVNIVNYSHVVNSADRTLALLLEGKGRFPDTGLFDKTNDTAGKKPMNQKFSPELPFESRFFSVRLSADGAISFVDTGRIAAVSDETAVLYAKDAVNRDHEKGFIGAYRYIIQESDAGTMVIFLDLGRQLDSVRTFVLISSGITLTGFLLVSLLLVILSGRIVRPISESYEKQRQFITNASHDLKTPITILDADMDILEMENVESEWLTDMRKQTGRLTDLIQELVFLSRMDEKENHFQMIDFPISDVISETAESFEGPARMQEKSLSIQVQPMLSYCGDANTIRRLVTILMDNALKYSDEHGSISLSLEKTDRKLLLTVQNTCASIQKDEIPHFFERFYRGDKSRNSETGGYGIGLSIAQAIMSAHGGTLRADTKDGHSLTMTASFPVK